MKNSGFSPSPDAQGVPGHAGRRAVVRNAVWAVPAVTMVTAAPAFAASGGGDVGAFQLAGTCGVLGVLGPGFTLRAATSPLPVGTVITITGSGIANIGVLDISGGVADVAVVSATTRSVTLTAALPANAVLTMRTTLSISVAFTLNASVTLPAGYTASGAKTTGAVNSTLVLCSAS